MAKKKSRAGVENKKPNSNSPTQKKKGANQNQGGEQKARAVTEQVSALPVDDQQFHQKITIELPTIQHYKKAPFVDKVIEILHTYNMCIILNALSDDEISSVMESYDDLLDLNGVTAIGEKDASKRSGTRFYNCRCQQGPKCGFKGWREGADNVKTVYEPDNPPVWRQVIDRMDIPHIARVEMVTGHSGCRAQGWHVDALRGVTAIFAMTDVDLAKGPTQINFMEHFTSLDLNAGKVKGGLGAGNVESTFAAMPKGALVMFNANCVHRGTANLSKVDRPVLVLDCSADCGMVGK
ncbi:hypothetical protein TrVE_jg293 [Triparma verrucosa]|uniref:Uncharacterized protein n=1 Tax=Triparma verrucosa TaxID=1606542 RepID=A0A9W7CM09_9STRA|nr:hypothetical protein TrVE_jg293 [Triparma verrucosa]